MADEEAAPQRNGIKPQHIVVGLGVFIGLFTLTSGIVPLFTDWHDDSDVEP